MSRDRSRQPYVYRPYEPIRIAPFRLALDDERLTIDGELIARPRVGDLAHPQLEVAVSA